MGEATFVRFPNQQVAQPVSGMLPEAFQEPCNLSGMSAYQAPELIVGGQLIEVYTLAAMVLSAPSQCSVVDFRTESQRTKPRTGRHNGLGGTTGRPDPGTVAQAVRAPTTTHVDEYDYGVVWLDDAEAIERKPCVVEATQDQVGGSPVEPLHRGGAITRRIEAGGAGLKDGIGAQPTRRST